MGNIILYDIDVHWTQFSQMAAGRDGVFFALVCNGFYGLSCTPIPPHTHNNGRLRALDRRVLPECTEPAPGRLSKIQFRCTVFHDLQQDSASSFLYGRCSGETIGRHGVLLTLWIGFVFYSIVVVKIIRKNVTVQTLHTRTQIMYTLALLSDAPKAAKTKLKNNNNNNKSSFAARTCSTYVYARIL